MQVTDQLTMLCGVQIDHHLNKINKVSTIRRHISGIAHKTMRNKSAQLPVQIDPTIILSIRHSKAIQKMK